MCTSSSDAFAWVGFVLVNLGFVSLITWSTAQIWWEIGVVIALTYSVFLFWIAARFHAKAHPITEATAASFTPIPDVEEEEEVRVDPGLLQQVSEASAGAAVDNVVAPSEHAAASTKRSLLISSLLYGLAVLSLGVDGFLFTVKLLPDDRCDGGDFEPWQPRWNWCVCRFCTK